MDTPTPATNPPATGEATPAGTEPTVSASRYRLSLERADEIRRSPPMTFTVFSAAAYLNVSPRLVRDLIRTRKLRSTRVGAKHILHRSTLDAFLGVNATGGTS